MNPLILIIDNEQNGAAQAWIQKNAPGFFAPGHEIVTTTTPTSEQVKAAAVILLPTDLSYFYIAGSGARRLHFLESGLDSRDFVPGGQAVSQSLNVFERLICMAQQAAAAERNVTNQLRSQIASFTTTPVPAALDVVAEQQAVEAESEVSLTPEKAAEIEREAGAEIAKAGHDSLPDLATDAAKEGFAEATAAMASESVVNEQPPAAAPETVFIPEPPAPSDPNRDATKARVREVAERVKALKAAKPE